MNKKAGFAIMMASAFLLLLGEVAAKIPCSDVREININLCDGMECLTKLECESFNCVRPVSNRYGLC